MIHSKYGFCSFFILAALSTLSVAEGQQLGGELMSGSTGPELAKQGVIDEGSPLIRAAKSQVASPRALYEAIDRMRVDDANSVRGSLEARVYAAKSPAVVFIVAGNSFGSGSIIGNDGLLLTNWHVIEGHDTVGVIFKPDIEGDKVSISDAIMANVIKFDEVTDLALIRVKQQPTRVEPISLGGDNEISVGDDVHAIGHPTGESWTYTRGFVSQIRRNYTWITESGVEHRADVIQTQTPINPGNSGGPLLSSNGNLVGVNSFKAGGEALNFAIAVSEVRRFLASEGSRVAARAPRSGGNRGDVCGEEPVSTFRSEDGLSEVSLLDLNCDGTVESRLTIPDDRSRPLTLGQDTTGNGRIDTVYVDENRDGEIDYSLMDVNDDNSPDLIGYYRSGDDEPYRIERI